MNVRQETEQVKICDMSMIKEKMLGKGTNWLASKQMFKKYVMLRNSGN